MLAVQLHIACTEQFSECLHGNGSHTEVEISLEPINGIEVSDGLDVFIHYAIHQKILVKAGTKILPQIELSVIDSILYIQDNNQCNWSKAYESREVHIFIPKLNRVIQNGYGLISCEDTIPSEDLFIQARIGSGDIDLVFKSNYVEVNSSKYGTIRLKGETTKLKVNYLNNNAIFDARDLKADAIEIHQSSNNDFHLFPIHSLTGKLLKRGNVFLYHKPEQIEVEDSGHGEIIYVQK